MRFHHTLLDTGSLLRSIFATFPSFWHHFPEHRFRIDLGMDLGFMFVFLWYIFPFAYATCKTVKKQCFYYEFACLYTSETHDLHNFRYLFRHDLLMILGIDFGFILESFCQCFHVFRIWFLSQRTGADANRRNGLSMSWWPHK